MQKPYKNVELRPREWRSDRERPREPILGPAALPIFGELLVAVGSLILVILFFMLAVHLKKEAEILLFGEKQQYQSVPAGNYKWTPERGLERID